MIWSLVYSMKNITGKWLPFSPRNGHILYLNPLGELDDGEKGCARCMQEVYEKTVSIMDYRHIPDKNGKCSVQSTANN